MIPGFVPYGEMPPDLQCLVNCCKMNPTDLDIEQICDQLKELIGQSLSDFISLAHAHGVFPLVYQAICKYAADLVSKQSLSELKQSNMNIVIQNMYMSAEMIRVLALLNENSIQAQAFKGPALSELAYGDIALRQYCDLDILIKKQDIAKSITLLSADGYTPEINLPEGMDKAFFACVNVIGLGKTIRIEIHWELLSKNYAIEWLEDTLWKENDTVYIDGDDVSMLAYNTHLLYLCTHGAKHLFERLEWVCDIDRLIRAKPNMDWQSLFEDARTLGIERMLLLGLYLAHQLLGLPLPRKISVKVFNESEVEALGRQIISLNFSTPDKQGRSYGTFGLLWRMRENYTDRLRFAWRAMFAPKFDDFKALQLPAYLVFLYPVVRPFRLLVKYFRR